jgi:hypothetical protein
MVRHCHTELTGSKKKESRVALAKTTKKKVRVKEMEVEETSSESEDSGKE